MRLIDADALAVQIRDNVFRDFTDEFWGVMQCIGEAPTIEPEPQWNPCSERLPEEGERVLATHLGGLNPSRQVIEHIYLNGKFTCGWDMDDDVHSPTFGQRFMGKVVAWMPLPEPYKEGEQDD